MAALHARGGLGGDQQQLHRHQGGLGGRANPLELGHAEELQQAQMHDHAHGSGEPPPPKHHHHKPKATGGPATQQPGEGRGGAPLGVAIPGGRNGLQRSAAIKNRGSAAASLAWLPRRCMRCTVA